MADDFTLEMQAPKPDLDERLSREASREASRWKLSSRRGRCPALTLQWREAADSLGHTLRELRESTSDPGRLSGSARWLVENTRLLRTTIQETGDSLELTRSLRQIETEGDRSRSVPRAYAASVAFLRATAFAFDEQAFVLYFRAVQQHGTFEVGELWALRPMMQLALLEEIAAAAKRLRGDAGDYKLAVPMPNLITSLRDIVDAPWQELFEQVSEAENVLRQDPSSAYSRMDTESRGLYRGAVQELALYSGTDEVAVARKAVDLASLALKECNADPRVTERRSHVGYYLVDKGRKSLQSEIGYRPPLSKQIIDGIMEWPEGLYLVGVELLTLAIMAFVLSGLGADVPLLWTLLLLALPATESAVGVMNQLVAFLLPPRPLPKLDFSRGIPADCTTMVAVPTLVLNEQQVRQIVRDLEIRYLGNRDPNLYFALLTDSPDSLEPGTEPHHLVKLCSQLVEGLNRKYCGQAAGSFFHFHRHQVYNPGEGVWMGWERKRGKLLDFNNLLRGGYDSFPVKIGDLSVLPAVRYVITLDADTQLPRESAHRLVGTLAHPLNRAVVNPSTNMVEEGYGILQPRVGVSVRSANRSRLANIYSGQTGFDIYTRAVSNVYQDLVGEGSFTGKGIYDVDVFQRVLWERFPLNAILSHDLIEGAYCRAGLVSDIEVIDDYPLHFSAYSRRKHRWVRGDWQIMRWLLPRVPDYSGRMVPNPISPMSRWKILDNLRRSLTEPATFVLLLAGWFWLPGGPHRWTVAVLALLLIPAYVRALLSLVTMPRAKNRRGLLRETADAFVADQVNVFMLLAFLAHQVLVTLDAIIRTLVRLTITRRRLLEWETAAQSEVPTNHKTPADLYLKWTPFVPLMIAVLLNLWRPNALIVAWPVLVLWACPGLLSQWLNRPLRAGRSEISADDEQLLRQAALRTWRFFRTLSNARTNWLIPDNIQEDPAMVAQRISPTNLGLLLNARLAAQQLGYLTVSEFVADTEKSMATARRLRRYNGHFFNWYDTQTLRPLEPLFISTIDSGNLACCLWTLKQGCLHLLDQPILHAGLWQGIRDHLRMFETPGAQKTSFAPPKDDATAWMQALPALLNGLSQVDDVDDPELHWWVGESVSRLAGLRQLVESLLPWLLPEYQELMQLRGLRTLAREGARLTLASLPEFVGVLEARLWEIAEDQGASQAARSVLQSLLPRLPLCVYEAELLQEKLRTLAEEADSWVRQMDFRWLYNPRRKVLSVGYDLTRQRLEKSCYELLASEARNAAFVAIAKGDVPQKSWFHLGRAHTVCDGKRVLLSWSGTMFEYLLPALWMRVYPQTLLDQSLRSIVHCQRQVSRRNGVPWGISESAFSQTDAAGRYQYQAFGLRGLALQPTMHSGLVVSPYASFLALAVNAPAAVANLRAMKAMGWLGAFGFYEAADFRSSTAHQRNGYQLVRSWMAHHQGMILLSVCNLLDDFVMQSLFHAEPMVAATERLLHEIFPRTVAVEPSEEDEPPQPYGDHRASKISGG